MAGVNKVILVGNLGTDPEVKVIPSGAKVARLNIATSESYTNKEGQRITNTEWHNVNVWRGLADVSEKYLKKGDKVYVEGKIRTRSYEKDGEKRYITEIEADTMTMLGSRGDGQPGQAGGSAQPQQAKEPQPAKNMEPDSKDEESFDDLPF